MTTTNAMKEFEEDVFEILPRYARAKRITYSGIASAQETPEESTAKEVAQAAARLVVAELEELKERMVQHRDGPVGLVIADYNRQHGVTIAPTGTYRLAMDHAIEILEVAARYQAIAEGGRDES